jgi:hypothetical protein
MTKLTFYGGVNEIGGNKILLEDEETKIFLDFVQIILIHFLTQNNHMLTASKSFPCGAHAKKKRNKN